LRDSVFSDAEFARQSMAPHDVGHHVTRFIQYPSQQEAFKFLEGILADQKALGLLHGPEAAGKSELIDQIATKVRERAAVAVVDGSRLKPTKFLTSVLTEFGYDLELSSVDELVNMLNVFAVQQARSREAPVLILEHFNHMYPSTLHVLCQLAMLTVNKKFALRIILVGDRYFRRVIDSPRMLPIAIRLAGDFAMQPLTARESVVYLYAKLEADGIGNPDSVFPADICDSLYAASGGWPGNLDRIAESALEKLHELPGIDALNESTTSEIFDASEKVDELDEAEDIPVLTDVVPPRLIISHNGAVVRELELAGPRTLLGRSAMSDVVIDHEFISKHHALLVWVDDEVMLLDLKSRNGTYVNGQRVERKILQDNDVLALGEYRVKLLLPAGAKKVSSAGMAAADTTKLKNLADARRKKARAALKSFSG
jgi:type II secretory pathway predicted ATPase ExeA